MLYSTELLARGGVRGPYITGTGRGRQQWRWRRLWTGGCGARPHFAQPDHASALAQLEQVVDGLQVRFTQAATLLADAVEDLLAHKHFLAEHRTRLHSTNPLERLNKEIKRRSNVAGSSPNPAGAVTPRGDNPDGTGRRMGRGRPALLQRRVNAPAHAAAAPDDGAGATHGDCLNNLGTLERCGQFPPFDGTLLLADLFKLPTTFPWLSDWLSAAWCPDNLWDRCVSFANKKLEPTRGLEPRTC